MHRRLKRKERRAALLCSADCGDRRAKWRRMPKQHKKMLHTLRLQRVLDRRRVARDFVNAAVGVFIEMNYQRQKSQAAMPLQLGLGSASPWIATAARDDGSDGQNSYPPNFARALHRMQADIARRVFHDCQCKLTFRDLATVINTDIGLWQRADGNRRAKLNMQRHRRAHNPAAHAKHALSGNAAVDNETAEPLDESKHHSLALSLLILFLLL